MTEEWLTYAEAADRLSIKPDSVKRRARAKNWPRRVGNDGFARVQLPSGDAREVESSPDDPPLSSRLAAAETEVRLLRERLADLTADRDALRAALAAAAAPQPRQQSLLSRLLGFRT